MPETNGLELAQAAHQISPDVRIVLMSGALGRDELATGAAATPLNGFLHKPFILRELREILRKNEIFA
jgi:CheY-like chemotaxis protein